jgi:pseudouridine synthase
MRIQKYLSLQGIASRREAEQLIKDGLVSLNGKIVTVMGIQIDPAKDKITVRKDIAQKKTTIIINKPRGITSSRIQSEGKTIYELFPHFDNLDIVGRLDKESEGLLMLSDDGVIAKAVTGEAHKTEKEYIVSIQENIISGKIMKLEKGVMLEDGLTLPCKISRLSKHTFNITIREGRKHQIRRMCGYLNLTVTKLKRIRIGSVLLGQLASGEFRKLSAEEVASFKF